MMPLNLSIKKSDRDIIEKLKLIELVRLRSKLQKARKQPNFDQDDLLGSVQLEIMERVNAR